MMWSICTSCNKARQFSWTRSMMAEVECKCGGRTKLINSIIKSGPHPVYSNQTITNRLNEESHIEYHLEGVSYYLTPDGTKFEIKQRKTREFLEI